MNIGSRKSGFTMIELVISLSIILIIAGIGATALVSSKSNNQVKVIADSIASKAEEAKSDSISGKENTSYGIKINSTSYVFFKGNSYSASDPNNITYPLSAGFTMTNNIYSSDDSIVFAKLTGVPSATGTIIISSTSNASTTSQVRIGDQGQVSVIK